jgi:CheY-like chemotaxis protein
VLVEIKHEQRLRSIPVVILSTSCRSADKQRAHDLGASRYISKPYRLADFVTEVGSAYWELIGHERADGDIAFT